MIGGLDENVFINEHFVPSRLYYHDKLTWCVQKKRPIPAWKNIFYVCNDPLVWVAQTMTNILSVFFIYFFQRFEDVKWDWNRINMIAFCAACGFPIDIKAQIIPHRIFYIFAQFGLMIFTNTFLSFLLLFLMNPIYDYQFQSKKDILDASFELAGDEIALHHLTKQNEVS